VKNARRPPAVMWWSAAGAAYVPSPRREAASVVETYAAEAYGREGRVGRAVGRGGSRRYYACLRARWFAFVTANGGRYRCMASKIAARHAPPPHVHAHLNPTRPPRPTTQRGGRDREDPQNIRNVAE